MDDANQEMLRIHTDGGGVRLRLDFLAIRFCIVVPKVGKPSFGNGTTAIFHATHKVWGGGGLAA